MLAAMNALKARLAEEAGLTVGEVEVQLFSTREEYNLALGTTAPADQVGNVIDAGHIWMLAPNRGTAAERADILKGVQVELTRATLWRVQGLTRWMTDGIASYEARLWDSAREQYMRSLVGMRRVAGLRALDGPAYNYLGGAIAAHTAIDYLVRTYGVSALARLVAAVPTNTLDQAFTSAVGVSFTDFDRAWTAYVLATYGR